ncbi:MAG: FlgD immunoglobulin-like domain containing protein [Candidatus Eisenbacteria bacterium]
MPSESNVIDSTELKLGDILNWYDHHVVIFKEWDDYPCGNMTIGHASGEDGRVLMEHNQDLTTFLRKGYVPRRSKHVAPDISISHTEVTGGDGCITLSWTENNGSGWYHIYRSDHFYGPYREIANFASGDERYTQNGKHYTYPDNTVQYFREYWYRVLDKPFGWGMAQGLPPAILPSTPTGLVASNVLADCGNTVSLLWQESVSADSYYVFRSPTLVPPDYPACPDFLGTTLLPEYVDSTVVADSLYSYIVIATNGTGSSDCSAADSVIAVRELAEVSVMQSRVFMNDDSLLVCPGGDGDSLAIGLVLLTGCGEFIRGEPMSSFCAVLETTAGNVRLCFGDTLRPTVPTDDNGYAEIVAHHIGGCGTVSVHVYARGQLLAQQPVVHLRSPDLNADGVVDSLDCSAMNQGGECTDLNWDGEEGDGLDWSILMTHWLHTSAPSVAVTSPNGSEWWEEGTEKEISWQFTPTLMASVYGEVDLLLSTDGGVTYPTTIGTSLANDGSHLWTIPAGVASADCRVKAVVRDAHGCEASDVSNESFSLAKVASGLVDSNTTWNTPVSVTGDVTVAQEAQLSVAAGTKVKFHTSDALGSGVDPAKCELIVDGRLVADGSESSPIVFESISSSPQAGHWRGIRLRDSSTNNVIDNCDIKHAYTGIEACSTAVTVDSCVISSFTNDGIKAVASTVTITSDSIALGTTGVRGIELTTSTSGSVTGSFGNHNSITASGSGTTYGILLSGDGDLDIAYTWINGPKYGIKCSGGTTYDIAHNLIKNSSGNGIQCAGDAVPLIRYTTIEPSGGTSMTVIDEAGPNLGAYPDSGSNCVGHSTSSGYYVANLTEYQILAEYNWWGLNGGAPAANKFYGDVDYNPYNAGDPGLHTSYSRPLGPSLSVGPAAPYVVQNYPNPFNPQTTIEYGVSEAGSRVRVIVYDIVGRAVKVLVNESKPAGHFKAVWDGRNEQGQTVASGVYFYEVEIGGFRQTKKLVVLK